MLSLELRISSWDQTTQMHYEEYIPKESGKADPCSLSLTFSFHKIKYEAPQLQELVLFNLPCTTFFFFFSVFSPYHSDPSSTSWSIHEDGGKLLVPCSWASRYILLKLTTINFFKPWKELSWIFRANFLP